jgi:hypothetical protein
VREGGREGGRLGGREGGWVGGREGRRREGGKDDFWQYSPER